MSGEITRCPACGKEIKGIESGCERCGDLSAHMPDGIFLPGPRGPVSDFAFLYSEDQYKELTEKLEKHFERTRIPLVVATMDNTGDLDPSDYASLLYNWWGIGVKRVNRGVLILISTSDRRIESEVGLGLEKYIGEKETDDALSGAAGPLLREDRFFEGINAALDHLIMMIDEKVPGQGTEK